jgi:surface protein
MGTRFLFSNCSSLVKLDLSNFKTPKNQDAAAMFQFCYKLEELDLSNFEIHENPFDIYLTFIHTKLSMFNECKNLRKLKIKRNTYEAIKEAIPNNPEIEIV